MRRFEYQRYYDLTREPPPDVTFTTEELRLAVHVAQPMWTLCYGYDLDRTTVHVYLDGPDIMVVRYDSSGVLKQYAAGPEVVAKLMVPTKRAYPERTDYFFARAMHRVGHELCFTTFPQDGDDPGRVNGLYPNTKVLEDLSDPLGLAVG